MIHIINGPNLNLLGLRQQQIYGRVPFEDYLSELRAEFPDVEIYYYQSNHEGDLIDYLQQFGFQENTYFLFNPGGYTHTSIALADVVAAISAPVVEVHISDIENREEFRKISYLREHCAFTIQGQGLNGYKEAMMRLLDNLN